MTSFTADGSLLAGEPHDPKHPQQLADGYLPASMTPEVVPAVQTDPLALY